MEGKKKSKGMDESSPSLYILIHVMTASVTSKHRVTLSEISDQFVYVLLIIIFLCDHLLFKRGLKLLPYEIKCPY